MSALRSLRSFARVPRLHVSAGGVARLAARALATGACSHAGKVVKSCFPPVPNDKNVYVFTSGDLRQSANKTQWKSQKAMIDKLGAIVAQHGYKLIPAHVYDPAKGHGFLDSQRAGIQAFDSIPPNARVLVAECVWQYSHHVLSGLLHHQGPVLTVANWDGTYPGLVGMLNLNGCMRKFGVPFSSLWSVDFTDKYFNGKLLDWLQSGKATHDLSHVKPFNPAAVPAPLAAKAQKIVDEIMQKKIILGVFDEGCMGMANAIFEDHLLNPAGFFKERLSQSALFAEMQRVTDAEAAAVYDWLVKKGFTFHFGQNEATDLTLPQVLTQCKMYVAAVRIADAFKVDSVGIQYQQGLKDLTPASDLVEGLLNNVDRPPVYHETTGQELFPRQALPHFNEVDQGSAVDGVLTNRVWRALGLDPATTLHDIRWGDQWRDAFVWVFLISGAAPPSHFAAGYRGAHGYRQDPVYFPLGGSTIGGVSKAGEIVWSRAYVQNMQLCADLGRGTVVDMPEEEVTRRLNLTNPNWPIMNAVLHGVNRDQLMAQHPANHIQVAYGKDAKSADEAMAVKAAAFHKLGFKVNLCGDVKL